MLIKKNNELSENEVTDFSVYQNRRKFMKTAAGIGIAAVSGMPIIEASAKTVSPYSTDEKLTDYKDITTYCNFYEFGTGKEDPAKNAHTLVTSPWDVIVEGECEKPGKYNLEDLLKPVSVEERIYRFRCVEGWSMVIPWMGFPLADLIKRMQPTSKAKYVYFETLHDPKQMPGQRRAVLDWPYVEGLRMDEAMNPLTLMGTGIYGKDLMNQNGAPLRLVVPWKYGFKSIKSIAKIRFSETQPVNSWQKANENEYGFFSNVNPDVSHPRWSQRRERRIGEFRKIKTQLFNGYGEQVASLYAGMDLKKNF
ncbi:protein-methionine-sulfoxide reductase catalytic subunit MsrP [Cocleimonas sp. KMM 6892]|uniref:protein-methionine-sulfoxide reductase catalytic subunit MsrP n=1 Tax=unclassified Cocleimonas TaxID=2639732 RepID=UPI002DBDA1E8|nr:MULTISPECIES: protein-methionine-sulfoxide reductase catalytic subunit MsrP [unclassified Cocleimonas]MEB8430706.1 protein-methionine-sulfoxide reductase catalytic subunit MsrP [Cocleimonas sp. KMM 6892]MEC4714522.1 protein-methionine-sulfoxide reductase catalytic subunit MsrP [Cocleimonas sp. KMM 6895]MEC4743855.1 protein-methionine-sulfoxide reductase catalytic subunit MsrP [Cocleimonas sp. KMM 6896]